jgi:predicted enzyme related to lactoylglutathione lyase
VVVPASDVPGVGRFAMALDPDGAQFAVIASVPA